MDSLSALLNELSAGQNHSNTVVADDTKAYHELHHVLKHAAIKKDEVSDVPGFSAAWRYLSSITSASLGLQLFGQDPIIVSLKSGTKEKYCWYDVNLPGTNIVAEVKVFSKPKVYLGSKVKLLNTVVSLKLALNDHGVKHIKNFDCVSYNKALSMLSIASTGIYAAMVELALIVILNEHFATKDHIMNLKKVFYKHLKNQETEAIIVGAVQKYLRNKIE